LQAGGKVWRFANDRLLLRQALADQISNDYKSGGDADARLEFDGFHIEATYRVDDGQPGAYRPLGVIVTR